MDFGRGKIRMNAERDRLSNLPDELIHRILFVVGIKLAIKTSVLSSRWRYIWTSMSCLDFSSEFIGAKSVTHVLSGRNNQIEVSSVKLNFGEMVKPVFFERVLDYASFHNVQQLYVECWHERGAEFPQYLFSSHCLKHLTLRGKTVYSITSSRTWKLPALATLNLYLVILCGNYADKCFGFSKCANLKNLTLSHCKMRDGFNICNPGLCSLTLIQGRDNLNVVTPQLKNLVINNWKGKLMISAPKLSSLHYTDTGSGFPLDLSSDFLHLEKVEICIHNPSSPTNEEDAHNFFYLLQKLHSTNEEDAHKFVSLLQKLHSVKSLALNWESIDLLSSSMELISHQPSPFANLKSLKIYPGYYAIQKEQTQPEIIMSTIVKNYLLDSSPGATLTMVSLEETRNVWNVALVRNLMRELEEELDRFKESGETKTTTKEQDREQEESIMETSFTTQPNKKRRWNFCKGMTHIKNYWEDLNEQLKKGYKNVGCIVSMLQKIEEVMEKLSTSHSAKLQARFSGLCAEADTITDNLMNHLKIQCVKKPRFKSLLS